MIGVNQSLAFPDRCNGSLSRERFDGNTLQYLYSYRDLTLAITGGEFHLLDPVSKVVPSEAFSCYKQQVKDMVCRERLFETGTNEQIYRAVHRLRLAAFGADLIRQVAEETRRPCEPGIDQRPLWKTIWDGCDTVVMMLTDVRYTDAFCADILHAQKQGKNIYILCSAASDGIIPTESEISGLIDREGVTFLPLENCFGCLDPGRALCPESLAIAVEQNRACILGYGEDALSETHSLRVPALIQVRPVSLYSRALTNIFSRTLDCSILVPKGFSILPYVSVVEHSTMTYYHLAILADQYGLSVYEKSPQSLYALEPGLFANFYDDHDPPVLAKDFAWDDCGNYWQARDTYYSRALNAKRGLRYVKDYCDCRSGASLQFLYDDAPGKPDAVLVHGICAEPGTDVSVLQMESGAFSPREYCFSDGNATSDGIISNFSFFMTENLRLQYNHLRKDRPQEQLQTSVGHIDYKLTFDKDGTRHESFPLYRKACLAKKRHGGYLEFPFRLGGGSVQLTGQTIYWQADQVDSPDTQSEVLVYTPYSTCKQDVEDVTRYRKEVGENRLNLVFIGEALLCIRKGSVLLPCIGVVVSLAGTSALLLEKALGAADADGYYPCGDAKPIITLDRPDTVSSSDWADIEWCYGGGLTLMNENTFMKGDNYMSWFQEEGWLSPLSRQTQESAVHSMERHPRTVVGITDTGSLCILVFSGRTKYSCGANYLEVCRIARRILPDLRYLINWDGGASSVLGWIHGHEFTELSYPAPSDRSCAGMARRINSMLFVSCS